MTQPTPKEKKTTKTKKTIKKIGHKEFGTSKLEEKFAKDFLGKLGILYEYQFKAASIGRYYDFYIPSANVLIEIDGDYYHGYGIKHDEKSPMQKRNERVDRQKDLWAAMHGIPVLRIWEHDINKNPGRVLTMLKEEIGEHERLKKIDENKKKRH